MTPKAQFWITAIALLSLSFITPGWPGVIATLTAGAYVWNGALYWQRYQIEADHE
jgi:hypothetical protein